MAQRHLRVCYSAPTQYENCMQCGKCLRTALAAHEAGKLTECRTLGTIEETLAGLRVLNLSGAPGRCYQDILDDSEDPEVRQVLLDFMARTSEAASKRARPNLRMRIGALRQRFLGTRE